MAIDRDFLDILVCPASRRPLREATAADLAALNARIQQGLVKNRGGAVVAQPLSAGLQPDGERVVYPIQDGIPILLTTEAIELDASQAQRSKS